ncbi:ROK family protein [Streptomyces sp. NL15-2K]|uniref:ROK family protein n=1 Tax=Streptomyces sp. NL15-2K TaxID=376149 RepID=UPI000F58EDE7|nr:MULTISPECIES: ROK family protein [Actinomycetes]WKX10055.1 ROK family protein [Kutzneria buriramensis]GCB51668.1 ROK-family transcriptional regulator [Streptomyces sp. NL15-2K]
MQALWPLGGPAEPNAPGHELPAVVGVADLRATNAAAILAAVRSTDPHPRLSTLAEATKLSRPTVEAIVEELTDCGLIEVAPAVSARGQRSPGRPARRFRFRPHAGFVVGVDVRPRSVSACLADLDGRVVAVERRSVRADLGGQARARAVTAVVRRAIDSSGADARRVWAATIGTPGLVNRSNTRIRQADNLKGWAEADVVTTLRDALGCPVAVENDANLAALGEQWRGVGGSADEMVFVLLGERLGAGIITGGRLLRGHRGAAGEIGFIRFPGSTSSQPGLEPLVENVENHGADLVRSAGADIVRGAASGDPEAVAAITSYGRRLAAGIAPVLLALDPALVVLGTSLFAAPDLLPAGELLLSAAEEEAGSLLVDLPQWRLSSLGDEAVITGAVRFALSSVEEVLRTRPTLLPARGR